MTAHIVTVNVDDTIDHTISLMIRHRISGLPVLSKAGRPVGIISEFDLLKLICDGGTEESRVCEYMSPSLDSVSEQDDWVVVADIFRSGRLRRLPVCEMGCSWGLSLGTIWCEQSETLGVNFVKN